MDLRTDRFIKQILHFFAATVSPAPLLLNLLDALFLSVASLEIGSCSGSSAGSVFGGKLGDMLGGLRGGKLGDTLGGMVGGSQLGDVY